MSDQKIKEIRSFCMANSNPANIVKYSRYFKEGFDGYGLDQKVFEAQRDKWIEEWKHEMTIQKYLDLGDQIFPTGKYEEITFTICFLKSERENYTEATFDRIGKWFDKGIFNWASTDVLCMLVLSSFFIDNIVGYEKLKEWTKSGSEWQRRAVPVTLVELVKNGLRSEDAFLLTDPIILDKSEYVQKGIGTLLRGLWKLHPVETEDYLLKWKDQCGRVIIQVATEKMEKEYRKKFRKSK